MSVRSDRKNATSEPSIAAVVDAAGDLQLAEGNSYCVASPDNPLTRNVNVAIRASLNSLCLQKNKGTWAPSTEALKNIFQQKKFVSLEVLCHPAFHLLGAFILHILDKHTCLVHRELPINRAT